MSNDELPPQPNNKPEQHESSELEREFRSLLDMATMRIADPESPEGEAIGQARWEAFNSIRTLVEQHGYEGTRELSNSIQIDSPKGMRDVKVFRDIVSLTTGSRSSVVQEVRQAILDIDEELEGIDISSANYLAFECYKRQVIDGCKGFDIPEQYRAHEFPFRIDHKHYAVLSPDMNQVLVAKPESDQQIDDLLEDYLQHTDPADWLALEDDFFNYEELKESDELIHDDSFAFDYDVHHFGTPWEEEDDENRENEPRGYTGKMLAIGEEIIETGTSLEEITQSLGIHNPDLVENYITILRPENRNTVEQHFNITLSDFTLAEQLYFLNYLQHTTVGEAERMREFTNTYSMDGVRTFLTLQQEGITGDDIVAFAEQSDNAYEIFYYYAMLLDHAAEADSIIAQEIGDTSESNDQTQVAHSLQKMITQKARNTLVKAIVDGNEQDVLETIKRSQIDSMGTAESYRALRQAGLVQSPEDMQSISRKSYSWNDLRNDPETKNTIYALFYERETDERASERIASLEKHLQNPNSALTVQWLQDRPVASVLIEEQDNNVVYIGASNATEDSHLQNLRLGAGLTIPAMEQYAQAGKTVQAIAPTEVAVSYINTYGCIAREQMEDSAVSSQERLLIERNDSWQLESKSMSRSELVNLINDPTKNKRVAVKQVTEPKNLASPLGNKTVFTKRFKYQGTLYDVFELFPIPE